MKTTVIAILILFVAVFNGCSGRVQTNPLPKENNLHLPNYQFSFDNNVGSTSIAELNEYAKREFSGANTNTNINSDEAKNIWEIGKEIDQRGKL